MPPKIHYSMEYSKTSHTMLNLINVGIKDKIPKLYSGSHLNFKI